MIVNEQYSDRNAGTKTEESFFRSQTSHLGWRYSTTEELAINQTKRKIIRDDKLDQKLLGFLDFERHCFSAARSADRLCIPTIKTPEKRFRFWLDELEVERISGESSKSSSTIGEKKKNKKTNHFPKGK